MRELELEIIKSQQEDFIIQNEISIIKKNMLGKIIFFLIFILMHSYSLSAEICRINVSQFNGYVFLNGKWNFFRGGGTAAINPDIDISDWRSLEIPFRWNSVKELQNYKGEIWLRCNIYFQNLDKMKELYIDLGFVKEIDEVFWNGTKIGSTGDFKKKIPDFSERRIYSVPPNVLKEENVVAIHLYGSFWNAGLKDSIKLYFDSSFLETKKSYETFALVFSIIYILSSIFFIAYGIYTKEKKRNFYFAFFSIFLAFYHIILWGYRYVIFNNYIVSYVVELLLLIPLPYFFLGFLTIWLKIEKDKIYKIVKYFGFLLMFSAFIGLFIPSYLQTAYLNYITYINLLNLLIALIKTILIVSRNSKEIEELKYLRLGLFFLIPFIINDSLVALGILHTHRLFVFAYPLFLLSIALNLSEKALILKREILQKSNELRKLEKEKLHIIYNISNEFQYIFDSLKQSLESKKNHLPHVLKLEYLMQSAEMLDLLENDKYQLIPVKINLKEEVEEIIKDTLLLTQEKKKRVTKEIYAQKTDFWTDQTLFRLIVFHLLENALLYTKEEVNITIDFHDDTCYLRVRDHGAGIPLELQDKIFEKYIRGNHNKPGSGIGLSLVREAVFHLNGLISFETKLNFYTDFEIQLPSLRV